MVTKVVHTSDLHLGMTFKSLGEKSKLHRNDCNDTFSKIIDLCIKENVDALLIAGDFFDSANPTKTLVNFVIKELKRLNDELEKRVAERTQELRSSRAFLEAILNSTIDAVLTIDCYGTIQSINKSTINLFGFEEVELLGKNLSELLPESYHSEYMQDIS